MTKTYHTTNPQGLIDMFEQLAKTADTKPRNLARDDVANKREAYAWRAAADILRNTEFVGWNVGMIVDDVRKPAPTDFTAAADYVAEAKAQGVHDDDEPTRKGEEMGKHGMFDYSDDKED